MKPIWNYEEDNHGTALASMIQAADNVSVVCPYIVRRGSKSSLVVLNSNRSR